METKDVFSYLIAIEVDRLNNLNLHLENLTKQGYDLEGDRVQTVKAQIEEAKEAISELRFKRGHANS